MCLESINYSLNVRNSFWNSNIFYLKFEYVFALTNWKFPKFERSIHGLFECFWTEFMVVRTMTLLKFFPKKSGYFENIMVLKNAPFDHFNTCLNFKLQYTFFYLQTKYRNFKAKKNFICFFNFKMKFSKFSYFNLKSFFYIKFYWYQTKLKISLWNTRISMKLFYFEIKILKI